MILHDFMLSWYPNIPYPAYPAYRERIQAEVKQKLTALARHPAIVLWFGMSAAHNR
jgi:beta-galactosidase/beta-glucuronidase